VGVRSQAKEPAGGVDGVVDGVPYPAEYGRPRPDVATTFGVPSYANSGYVLELLGQRFVPRAHTLFIRVLTHDSKGTLGGGLNPELETVAKGTGYHLTVHDQSQVAPNLFNDILCS
jgi:hypothetical protein